MPLVSFTLNIPGPKKQSPGFDRLHETGLQLLLAALPVFRHRKWRPSTGSEALLACSEDARHIKSITVGIEEFQPWGRLCDMDVLDRAGRPLSRRDLGLSPRRCLLCRAPAAECARSRAHPLDALLACVTDLAGRFLAPSGPAWPALFHVPAGADASEERA